MPTDTKPGTMRLPGFDGSALMLRSVVLPDDEAPEGASLTLDVELITVERRCCFPMQDLTPGTPASLSAYLWAAASDEWPEQSAGVWADGAIGLSIEVLRSDASRVQLLVRMQSPLDPAEMEIDFDTSRTALAQAAIDVRLLDDVEGRSASPAVIPEGWTEA